MTKAKESEGAARGSALPFGWIDRLAVDRLLALRGRLFEAIAETLKEDGHCKSYEGAFAIHLPNYFQQQEPEWSITLDCYVVGPNRHYAWSGATLTGAVEKAEETVGGWLNAALAEGDPARSAPK